MRRKIPLIFLILFLLFLFKDFFYMLVANLNPTKDETINLKITLLERENKELKKELEEMLVKEDLIVNEAFDYIIARVSIRNAFTFYDTLIIDKGKKQGIEKGMAVVNEKGLVGRIREVNERSSVVDLITKPNNDISIIVHGAYGTLAGFSKENDCLIIRNLNNYEQANVGDLIYTSGLSNIPGSILIGKITKVNYDRFKIEKRLCVEKSVDLEKLHYVAVIKKRVDIK